MRVDLKLVALFGFICVGLSQSAPIVHPNSDAVIEGQIKCPGVCADAKNFNYQVGKSYFYNFNSTTKFESEDGQTSPVESELKIAGQARITVESKCEHQIKLVGVSIEGIQQTDLIAQLEKHPLAYFYNDGAIQSVCPLQDDSKFALNVKRAILSALQVSVDQQLEQLQSRPSLVSEDDIVGRCDTQYVISQASSESVALSKRKLLGTCTNRVQMNSGLQAGSAVGEVLLRTLSSAGLQQKHECNLQVSRPAGIVLKSHCSGLSDADQMFADPIRFRSSIQVEFDNEQPIHYPPLNGPHYIQSLLGSALTHHSDEASTLESSPPLAKAVENVCETLGRPALDSVTADSFDELVRSMRASDFDTLHSVYQSVLAKRNAAIANKQANKEKCCPHRLFKVYVDAAKSAKTEHTLKLLVQQLVPFSFYRESNDWRQSMQLRSFYSSLGFYPSPNEATLEAARPLLQAGQPKHRAALIGVSALVRAYVNANPSQADSTTVQTLANEIAGSNVCVGSSADEQTEINTRLHALHNFRSLPQDLVAKLIACAQSDKTPLSTRVAALKAANRRHSENNKQQVSEVAKGLLFDNKQPDELRVIAFRAFMRTFEWEKDGVSLQKLIDDGGEVASFIASYVSNLRAREHITCPFVLRIKQELTNLRGVEQAALSGRSRFTTFKPQLGYILRDQLGLRLEFISDAKTEQSYSIKASARLAKSRLISVGIRQTLNDQGSAQVQQLTEAAQTLIQSLLNGGEQLQQRLQQVLPGLQSALQGAEFTLKIDGKLIYYRAANEKSETVAKQLVSSVQLGLSELLASQSAISMQVQGFSGVPSVYNLRRTWLLSVPQLYGSETESDERAFDLVPNLVVRSELMHRIAVGDKQHLVAQLQRRSYLSSGFSVHASLKSNNDGWQLRLRLPTDQVELFTYRVQSALQRPNQPAIALKSNSKSESEWRLDNALPIKSLLGASVLVKSANGLRRVVIEQEPGSSLVISDLPIQDSSYAGRRYTIRLENSGKPRELSFERRFGKTLVQNTLVARSPLMNANAQANVSDNLVSLLLQVNDGEYEVRWSREHQSQGSHGYRVTHLLQVNPSATSPFTVKGELNVDRKNGLRVNAQLTVDEKRKLIDLMYECVTDNSAYKMKSVALRLQINSLRGKQLWNGVHVLSVDNNVYKYDSKITYMDYWLGAGQQLKNEFTLKMLPSDTDHLSYQLDGKMSSTAAPALNNIYKYKLLYKTSSHLEHELHVQNEQNTKKEIKLTHVVSFKGFEAPVVPNQPLTRSTDHLLRVYIGPVDFNREYTYNGIYQINSHPRIPLLIDTKLKGQDLSTAKPVFEGNLKSVADPANANRVLVDGLFNCHKHGQVEFKQVIDITDKMIESKIDIKAKGENQKEPETYTGYVRTNKWSIFAKQFELKLNSGSDKKEVLHIEHDYSTIGTPHVKTFARAKLMDSITLYDYSVDYRKPTREGEISLVVFSVGQIEFSSKRNDKSTVRKWALVSKCGSLHYGTMTRDANVLTLEAEWRKLNRKPSKFNSKSIEEARASTDFTPIVAYQLQLSNDKGLVTIWNAQSAQLSVQCPDHRLLFKHESGAGLTTTKVELENVKNKNKLFVMASKKNFDQLSVAFRLEKTGEEKVSGDLTLDKSAPIVLNLKESGNVLQVTVDPLKTKKTAAEWNIGSIQYTGKSRKVKHLSNLKVLNPSAKYDQRVYVFTSKTDGLDSSNQSPFERSALISVSGDMHKVKADFQINQKGAQHQFNWEHDLNKSKSAEATEYKLVHQVRASSGNSVVFAHKFDGQFKCEQGGVKKTLELKSQFDGTSPYLKNAGFSVSLFNSRAPVETKGSFSLELPHSSRSYKLNFYRLGMFGEKGFERRLYNEVLDKKLDYKEVTQIELNQKTSDYLAKFERRSLANHLLTHLEAHVKLGETNKVIKVVAPRGWKLEAEVDADKLAMRLHFLVQKRGRLVVSLDSDITRSESGRVRRSLINTSPLKVKNVIGWNGNEKFIEEQLDLSENEINYKFKGLTLSVDANLKRSDDRKKLIGRWVGCTRNGQRCCTIDFNHEATANGGKSVITADINQFEKPIKGQIEIERVNSPNGDWKGQISGHFNSQPIKGELRVENNSDRIELKVKLPKRTVVLSKERKSESVVQWNFWPDHEKNPQRVHTVQLECHQQSPAQGSYSRVHSIKLINPDLVTPVELKVTADKNIKPNLEQIQVSFAYSTNTDKNLQYELTKEKTATGMLVNHRISSKDKKLDAGAEIVINTDYKPQDSVQTEVRRTFYWVDTDGNRLTGGDFVSSMVAQPASKNPHLFVLDISQKLAMVYSLRVAVNRALASGQLGYVQFKNAISEAQRVEVQRDGPCFVFKHGSVEKTAFNQLQSCLYSPYNQTLAFVHAVTVRADAKQEERLLVKLEQTEDRDIRFVLNWDPEAPGIVIHGISTAIDEQLQVYEQNKKKMSHEFHSKLSSIAHDVDEEFIKRLVKSLKEEYNQLHNELEMPSLARSRRSVILVEDDDELPQSLPEIFKELFHVRVVKYDVEAGEIEILFRPSPSKNGVRKLVRQTINFITDRSL